MKEACVSFTVDRLRPVHSNCVFAVNLVRQTDAARSVYAANTSCVDIALAHCCKSSTLYHTQRQNTRGTPCFYSLWQRTVSLALLQRHLIIVIEVY